jgi:hypothetical protein
MVVAAMGILEAVDLNNLDDTSGIDRGQLEWGTTAEPGDHVHRHRHCEENGQCWLENGRLNPQIVVAPKLRDMFESVDSLPMSADDSVPLENTWEQRQHLSSEIHDSVVRPNMPPAGR